MICYLSRIFFSRLCILGGDFGEKENVGTPHAPSGAAAPAPRLHPKGALHPCGYWWRIQKAGKATTKTGYFPFSVANIDQLLCLKKGEHPCENQIRHQYPLGSSSCSHNLL